MWRTLEDLLSDIDRVDEKDSGECCIDVFRIGFSGRRDDIGERESASARFDFNGGHVGDWWRGQQIQSHSYAL